MYALPSTLRFLELPVRGGKQAGVADAPVKVAPVQPDMVGRLARKLDLPETTVVAAVGIPERTWQRRRAQAEALRPDEADRLFRLARVSSAAERVFGSLDKARRWLKQPHPMFEGDAPLDLLGFDAGARAVEEELGRIEFGDFA